MTHYNIFEGLTKINEDFSITPLLADKWEFSPDAKTLTFTLKPNVKFQVRTILLRRRQILVRAVRSQGRDQQG